MKNEISISEFNSLRTSGRVGSQPKSPKGKQAHPEDELQIKIVQYLQGSYPNILFTHVPNERKSRGFTKKNGEFIPTEAVRLKKMGVVSGCPDLLIFHSTSPEKFLGGSGWYAGMYLEIKIKPNKPKPAQVNFMEKLKTEGWTGGVYYDFDSAKADIDVFLK